MRGMTCFKSQWFNHSFISLRVPSYRTHTKCGKTPSTESRADGRSTYNECSLVPQGDCLRHCYYYLSAMQPSSRFLPPWLGQTRALLA